MPYLEERLLVWGRLLVSFFSIQHLQATKGKIPSYLWGRINLSFITPCERRDSCLFISYINASHEILSAQFLYLHTQHTHIYMFLCTSNFLHPASSNFPQIRATKMNPSIPMSSC